MRAIILGLGAMLALLPVAAGARDGGYSWFRHHSWRLDAIQRERSWGMEQDRLLLSDTIADSRGDPTERVILVSGLSRNDAIAFDGPQGFIARAGRCVTADMMGVRRELVRYNGGDVDEVTFRATRAQTANFDTCVRNLSHSRQ